MYCVAQTKRCMPCSLAISLETRPIKILMGVVSRLAIQLRSRDAHPRDPSHMLCLAFACARSPIATIKSIVQRISFIHASIVKKMGKRIRRRFKKVIKTVTKIILCRGCSTQVIPIDDNQTDSSIRDTNPKHSKMKVIIILLTPL